jgi:hypothetical protein
LGDNKIKATNKLLEHPSTASICRKMQCGRIYYHHMSLWCEFSFISLFSKIHHFPAFSYCGTFFPNQADQGGRKVCSMVGNKMKETQKGGRGGKGEDLPRPKTKKVYKIF